MPETEGKTTDTLEGVGEAACLTWIERRGCGWDGSIDLLLAAGLLELGLETVDGRLMARWREAKVELKSLEVEAIGPETDRSWTRQSVDSQNGLQWDRPCEKFFFSLKDQPEPHVPVRQNTESTGGGLGLVIRPRCPLKSTAATHNPPQSRESYFPLHCSSWLPSLDNVPCGRALTGCECHGQSTDSN